MGAASLGVGLRTVIPSGASRRFFFSRSLLRTCRPSQRGISLRFHLSNSLLNLRNSLAHPVRNRRIYLVELAHKKMVRVFHDHDFIFTGRSRNQAFQLVGCAINIVRAVHEELRLFTLRQIRKVRVVHRRSQSNQRSNSSFFATNAQPNPTPKTKTRNQKRNVWIFRGQKIQRRARIVTLAHAAIVFPFAHSRSAKIETQNRKSQRVQRFRRLINHFVVHRSAKQRMRMTHERSHRQRPFARAPENGLQTARRSREKEIPRFVLCAHKSSKRDASVPQEAPKAELPGTAADHLFNRLSESKPQTDSAGHISEGMPFSAVELFWRLRRPERVTVLLEWRDTAKYTVCAQNRVLGRNFLTFALQFAGADVSFR